VERKKIQILDVWALMHSWSSGLIPTAPQGLKD
jgi:hypothetical protein